MSIVFKKADLRGKRRDGELYLKYKKRGILKLPSSTSFKVRDWLVLKKFEKATTKKWGRRYIRILVKGRKKLWDWLDPRDVK